MGSISNSASSVGVEGPGVDVLGVRSYSGVSAGVDSVAGDTHEPSIRANANSITTESFTTLIYL